MENIFTQFGRKYKGQNENPKNRLTWERDWMEKIKSPCRAGSIALIRKYEHRINTKKLSGVRRRSRPGVSPADQVRVNGLLDFYGEVWGHHSDPDRRAVGEDADPAKNPD